MKTGFALFIFTLLAGAPPAQAKEKSVNLKELPPAVKAEDDADGFDAGYAFAS